MNAPSERDFTGRHPGEVGTAKSFDNFNPSYPAHNTQAARLLASLLQGLDINPLKAWRSLGIYRLSDTVYQLRGLRWPVVTDRLDVANRFAEPCRVALYRLPTEAINKAGPAGAAFVATETAIMTRGAA